MLTQPERAAADRRLRRAIGILAFFAVASVLQSLLYDLLVSQGLNITGDEPSYVMVAQSLYHLRVHIMPTIVHDLRARVFPTTYPPNATVQMVERAGGPTGVVSPFPPGLGALLVPFVALFGPVSGAVTGMIQLNTAGLMWLHQRASRLANLGGLAQAILAVLFAGPAILIATNQIYPDLLAGIIVAAAVIEIALVEKASGVSARSVAIVAAAGAVVPWLQPKNLVPAAVLAAALAVSAGRRRPALAGAGMVAIAASMGLLLLYNHHYYGHWLGLPEPFPTISRRGVQYAAGLLFDRNQGLFAQVPYCLAGLAALASPAMTRRAPVAAAAAALSFAAILALNGTYLLSPYGGLSPSGRFMWSLIPLSLPWAALLLARAADLGRKLWAVLALVLAAWAYQAEPILAGRHHFYNPMAFPQSPWPGWWPGLGGLLARFGRDHHYFGVPAWGFPVELAVALAVGVAVAVWLREPSALGGAPWRRSTSAGAASEAALARQAHRARRGRGRPS